VLLSLLFCIVPTTSFGQDTNIAPIAPPDLPDYEQPACPEANYVWMPGYWSYGQDGYFWVPGAWAPAAYEGALWTPGYWAFEQGQYFFHDGYWSDHVGYYGGVNYGFGYMGFGFVGGEWRHGIFFYNTAVTHVRFLNFHVYRDMEIVNRYTLFRGSRLAFSGGPRGLRYEPSREERMYEHEKHIGRTEFQHQHEFDARGDRDSYYRSNGGHPHITAVERMGHPDQPRPQEMRHEEMARPDDRNMLRHDNPPPSAPLRPGVVTNAQPPSRGAQVPQAQPRPVQGSPAPPPPAAQKPAAPPPPTGQRQTPPTAPPTPQPAGSPSQPKMQPKTQTAPAQKHTTQKPDSKEKK
jgi:hypothetical protein